MRYRTRMGRRIHRLRQLQPTQQLLEILQIFLFKVTFFKLMNVLIDNYAVPNL